ncbi:hypothetical protein A2U01_0015453, partial [Trifolium medium]|nr:hypothetical protein [Trifolium medium]
RMIDHMRPDDDLRVLQTNTIFNLSSVEVHMMDKVCAVRLLLVGSRGLKLSIV